MDKLFLSMLTILFVAFEDYVDIWNYLLLWNFGIRVLIEVLWFFFEIATKLCIYNRNYLIGIYLKKKRNKFLNILSIRLKTIMFHRKKAILLITYLSFYRIWNIFKIYNGKLLYNLSYKFQKLIQYMFYVI